MLPLPSQVQARTVTDELDREMELPEDIQRVVSLAPSITESMFCIDQGHKLVGVTKYSDYPNQAKNIPSVGSYINLNIERIVSLRPDVCLATKDGNPYQAIQQLERAGIPVFALDPRDLPAIMDTIEKLGQLLGVAERAEQVATGMRQELHELQEIVSRADTRPRVFFQIGISPIVSVGEDTFIHELINLAGGVNIAAADIQYPRYSREDVLIFNPDIILINSMSNEHDLVQAEIAQWQDFPQINAVRNGRIHSLEAALFNRPTPRLTKALKILVRLFHPECDSEMEELGWSTMSLGPAND
jgi:iron complex transport system substrate-binding protein